MCSQPVSTGGPGAERGLWDINNIFAKFQRDPREIYIVEATLRDDLSAPRLASWKFHQGGSPGCQFCFQRRPPGAAGVLDHN